MRDRARSAGSGVLIFGPHPDFIPKFLIKSVVKYNIVIMFGMDDPPDQQGLGSVEESLEIFKRILKDP